MSTVMLDRRAFLCAAVATALVTARASAQTAPASAGPADPKLIEDLVAANRILADQGVVDGYGHVSVRHPADPQRYLMSRSIAPEMVTASDVMEYDLDSNPVDARGRASYLERFIHGEIYRARPDVTAVVHNHSPSVIPFGVSTAPLRPLYHMSAFLGGGVPVFDIKTAAGQATDMLVRTPALGRALAQTLGPRPVALMRATARWSSPIRCPASCSGAFIPK
jgi:ribulose-5-phosphate 4-epimerase/fuculose-1-phosphate aldolase